MRKMLTVDDEHKVYMAYCTGSRSVEALARDLKVRRTTIYACVHRVRKELAPHLAGEIAARKADVHTTLMGVLHKATASFEASVGVKETIREDPVFGAKGLPLKGVTARSVTTRHHSGDSSFLTEIRGALSDIRKLWGMDAPTKLQVEELPTQMDIADRMKEINGRIRQHLVDCNRLPKELDDGAEG